ncbi:DNA repair protein RadC [Spirochaetia bacterium]|nr:DNA repair protein RadC [Spirochaetia bacterium]
MNNSIYPDFFGQLEVRDTGDFPLVQRLQAYPLADRPRERLFHEGPAALSDYELLAILLNTGIKGKNVIALAGEILALIDLNKDIPPVRELALIRGMGKFKASAVVAMLELGRRRWGSAGIKIRNPSDIYSIIRHHADRKQEHFLCLSLNGAHEVLNTRIVTSGLVNRTIVHPREVFTDAIGDRAAAVIVAHNHPSGSIQPSPEDDEITSRLKSAADILGLHFLDHLIFTDLIWFSYRESGRLDTLPSPETLGPAPMTAN